MNTELEQAESAVIDRHAKRAVKAVRAFADAGKSADPREPLADIIADLLTDLRYLANETDVEWSDVAARSAENFAMEQPDRV